RPLRSERDSRVKIAGPTNAHVTLAATGAISVAQRACYRSGFAGDDQVAVDGLVDPVGEIVEADRITYDKSVVGQYRCQLVPLGHVRIPGNPQRATGPQHPGPRRQ